MGTAQHKNAPALLTTRGINTTHQVYNFDLPQGAQKLSVIKFQMSSFGTKLDFTFLL